MTGRIDHGHTPQRDTRSALLVFVERQTLAMMALGFAAGLPNLLIFDTLSAWLRDSGLSLQVIGYFSLATLAYSFKFLWAPLVDRTQIPGLTHLFGHRRSWMLACQALIIIGLWLVASTNPSTNLGLMALFAVFVGFSSATQDIVIDAWRIEAAEVSKQGAMAAAYQWGYRIAMVVAGAAPLFLAEIYSWNLSYGIMATLMGLGVAGVLFAPREKQHTIRSIHVQGIKVSPVMEAIEWVARFAILVLGALILGSGLAANATVLSGLFSWLGLSGLADAMMAAWKSPSAIWFQFGSVVLGFAIITIAALPIPHARTRPGAYLYSALGDPLQDFFRRYSGVAPLILALICVYRLSDFVLNIMNPFYLDLGFSLTEIAEVRKIFGVAMSMAGVFVGGLAVARLGLLRALVLGAFAAPVANFIFIWLATRGHDVGALFVAIGVDNVLSSFAGTCLIAYMSSLTAEGFTATQYALFSSLYSLPGKLLASQSGKIVESAARDADAGGPVSFLNGLFSAVTPDSFAHAFEKSGVSAAALGSGYAVFFLYSSAIGVFAVTLSFMVAWRQSRARAMRTVPEKPAAQRTLSRS
jgi:MFS transporter, PAT family, beta-lactamase induction signal transducer AmpG